MTRAELEERLRRERVDPTAYDLDNVGTEEAYCVEKTPGGWLVYYRERGHHNFEHSFSTESEAYAFFLKLVLQDPTTRENREQR